MSTDALRPQADLRERQLSGCEIRAGLPASSACRSPRPCMRPECRRLFNIQHVVAAFHRKSSCPLPRSTTKSSAWVNKATRSESVAVPAETMLEMLVNIVLLSRDGPIESKCLRSGEIASSTYRVSSSVESYEIPIGSHPAGMQIWRAVDASALAAISR